MAMVILILKLYIIFVLISMTIYTMRHLTFTINRLRGEQRLFYQDIHDSELPTVSVLIPMHNEELVARNVLERLLLVDYPPDKLEIIPINDHSQDKTREILDEFAQRNPRIKPIHRNSGRRGKPSAMNDAIALATGTVIIVFDADYLPPKGIIKELSSSFLDPEVGAVMGRVVPENAHRSLLTRLLDLERTGGYQVDQQARHNMRLLPQYGGTVGGFRRSLVLELGGFDPDVLTEDTDLTYRVFLMGYRVVYANRAECYEEVPEDWMVRARQVQRWAHGHTQCMYHYFWPLMRSRLLTRAEKLDGFLLLFIYTIPIILLLGILDSMALFFLGEMNIIDSVLVFICVAAYNSYGNFAPFYQIAAGALIDGAVERILLVPYLILNFIFNLWYISKGFFGATVDALFKRRTEWRKTQRFRREGEASA